MIKYSRNSKISQTWIRSMTATRRAVGTSQDVDLGCNTSLSYPKKEARPDTAKSSIATNASQRPDRFYEQVLDTAT